MLCPLIDVNLYNDRSNNYLNEQTYFRYFIFYVSFKLKLIKIKYYKLQLAMIGILKGRHVI